PYPLKPSIFESLVLLDDDRQLVFADLVLGQRQPLPIERAADLTFKNAADVVLNVTTGEIEVPKGDNAVIRLQQRCDVGAQEAADLPVGGSNSNAVLNRDVAQHASE